MCGRFVLTTPADALAREFGVSPGTGGLLLAPRYNIAPMQDVVVVRNDGGRRTLAVVRWGLIPMWAKDPAIASKMINARAETAASKPSFRDAMQRRRCIVPASGFYEWKKEGGRRQPWYFRSRDPRKSLAIAAIWERWRDPDHPEAGIVETCCLLTTGANQLCAPVHDRMPLILDADGAARWLDPELTDSAALTDLLVPAPDDTLRSHPVSTAVNAVRNDDARNIEEELPEQTSMFS
ncbi:MAG TPA: SOS response-associated peptidase [Candidatus Limnocylindrales bacterium]|nr:SOS response-associated peptidase [Candidatus Limnocylindrales bacterium]